MFLSMTPAETGRGGSVGKLIATTQATPGEGNLHVLGDRGTVRMEIEDVKRFDSGVVLLTYLPAS
jgi:hypothetical protein